MYKHAILYWVALNFVLLSCGGPQEKSAGSSVSSPVLSLDAFKVESGNVPNEIQVNGSILPWEEVVLTTEISGRIVHLGFKEGMEVQKGQLLVKIHDAEFAARLKQTQSKLVFERAQLERLQQLLKEGGVSKQEVEDLLLRIADLEGEELFILSQIEKTEIRAPWQGKIGVRQVSVGAVVNVGTPVATLRQVRPVKIEFKIPEKYAQSVQLQNPFSLQTDYLPGQRMRGFIDVIEPGVDPATRSLLLRGRINNPEEMLIPGTSARIHLSLDTLRDVFLIPDRAIVPIINGKQIFVVKKGIAKKVLVETDLRRNNQVVIQNGLQNGDTILVSGLMQVKEGMAVQIRNMVQQ